MAEHRAHEEIQFARIRPDAPEDRLVMRAKEILSFFSDRDKFYTEVLGLERTGVEPLPNPANMDEVSEIVHQIQGEKPGREVYSYVGAFAVNGSTLSELSEDTERDSALRGLMVLRKPDGHCEPGRHKPTEIVEWAVRTRERGMGYGRQLAVAAFSETPWLIHLGDPLFITIPEGDTATAAQMPRYGFTPSNLEPTRDDAYDTNRLRFDVRSGDFMQHIVPPEELVRDIIIAG